MIFKIPG